MNNATPYQVLDTLYLWYLGTPSQPVLVGDLKLVVSLRGVSLRYAPGWLQSGFPLSEDLPLIDIEHLPREKEVAAGAVDDARPDRWGERVIRLIERPPRLSLLEMLFFAGDDRFGALGVSQSREVYVPNKGDPLPQLADVNAVHDVIRKVIAGESVNERFRRLIAPGATMGGARPKALIGMEGAQWVLKFAEEDFSSEPLVEHASMTLAALAGITVAQTKPVKLERGMAVAIKRFDRIADRRLHALSANVALKAAGSSLSYPALAQLLRRRGDSDGGINQQQMRELFRRLIFNILIDNTDDHEKNHVLLLTDSQHYLLSPAFDVLPTGHALGYQSMDVGKDGAASSIENALSMSTSYGLKRHEAIAEAKKVAGIVDQWQSHFAKNNVDKNTIAMLTHQIDRPQLLEQRRSF
jgi:serine/threonine-protein kinase HipA